MFKTLSLFCNLRERILISIFFIFQFVISFLEFITLSLVPIFILYIENSKKAINQLEYIKNYFTENFFQLEINNLILAAFILLIFALIIKNLLQVLITFFEGYIVKILIYSNTNKVFSNFVNQNLIKIISEKSSELLRNITTDVSKSVGYLMCTLIILKEVILLTAIL